MGLNHNQCTSFQHFFTLLLFNADRDYFSQIGTSFIGINRFGFDLLVTILFKNQCTRCKNTIVLIIILWNIIHSFLSAEYYSICFISNTTFEILIQQNQLYIWWISKQLLIKDNELVFSLWHWFCQTFVSKFCSISLVIN